MEKMKENGLRLFWQAHRWDISEPVRKIKIGAQETQKEDKEGEYDL